MNALRTRLLRFQIALLVASLLPIGCSSFVEVAAADSHGGALSKKFASEDIRFAIARAEAVHPKLFWHSDKRFVLAREEALIAALPDPATSMDVYLTLSELAGLLGDGHVSVGGTPIDDLFGEYQKSGGFLLKVTVHPTTDGLQVVQSRVVGIRNGDVLRTINGKNSLDLFKMAEKMQSGEPAFQRYTAEVNFPQILWSLGIESPFKVDGIFGGKSGDFIFHNKEDSSRKTTIPKRFGNNGISSRYLPDGAYVIRFYDMMIDREQFKKTLLTEFKAIQTIKPKGLIVDLRANPGGNSGLGDDLLSYVNARPYRPFAREVFVASQECRAYFESQVPNDYVTAMLQQMHNGERRNWEVAVIKPIPNPLRFEGPVAFLIGPGTFSSANILANSIGDFHLAELIGQDTAETPNNYGMACPVILPHTRIEFRVPSAYFVRASGDEANQDDVHPDISVLHSKPNPTMKDVDMEEARKWIAEKVESDH